MTARVVRLAGIYSNVKQYTDSRGVLTPTKIILDFVCEYVEGAPADSNETESVMWVPIPQALELITIQPLRMRLENMLNCDGTVRYAAYEMRPYRLHMSRVF